MKGGTMQPLAIMSNCVTIHDVWIYPPDAATRLIALINSELLQLDQYDVTRFDLDHADEALAHVAAPVQDDGVKASGQSSIEQRIEGFTPSKDTKHQWGLQPN
jgi:hypothetical protein